MSHIIDKELIELTFKLSEGADQVCGALDVVLCLPDETPFTAGDLRNSFEAVKAIIQAQKVLIGKHADHQLEISSMLNDLVEKHTKK